MVFVEKYVISSTIKYEFVGACLKIQMFRDKFISAFTGYLYFTHTSCPTYSSWLDVLATFYSSFD